MNAPSDEAGFTLIELLIAMFIVVLVMTAVASAFIAGFDVIGVSQTRLTQTDDRQLVEIWLPQDVQSSQTAAATATATCGHDQTAGIATAVLVLSGSGEKVTTPTGSPAIITKNAFEADYVLVHQTTSRGGWRLVRYFCATTGSATKTWTCAKAGTTCTHQTLSYALYAAATGAVATYTKTKGKVSLTLKDTQGNTFSVSGQERT
jgi:prepilin-type N-terminal cleavage/methylation domain-containing protein